MPLTLWNDRAVTTNRTLVGLAAVALALLGAGCGGDDDDAGRTGGDAVSESSWVLVELGGEPVADGVEVTLQYDGETIAGSAGCNTYNGGATFDDGTVTVSPAMATTLMACEGPAAEVETAFLQTLPTATAFVVIDDELRMSDGSGQQVLVFSAQG